MTSLSDTDNYIARKAAYALGNGWGEEALGELSGALSAPDARLREAAARSLGGINTPAAREALSARLPVEDEPAVREVISAALAN